MLSSLVKEIRNRLFRKSHAAIEPDEIFLDSSNLPAFDTTQMEGRLEKPISKKTFFIFLTVLFVVGTTGLGRLWFLQVQNGKVYAEYSQNNRLHHSTLFAERGVIYDRNGTELAWNVPRENEPFPARVYTSLSGLSHALGYVRLPQKDAYDRFYVDEYEGLAGVEASLNQKLAGKNGLKIIETDALGEVRSESTVELPQDGENITLSIDAELTSAMYGYIKELSERVGFVGGAGANL